jgi:hypothetical protein
MNNTLYLNDTMNQGYGEITLQNYNENNVFLNNILYTFPSKKFILNDEKTGRGNIVDYNLYFRTDALNSTSWRYNGVKYKTWDAFKSATGFDNHSIFVDPLFLNIDTYGPYLSEASPAIDQGLQYDDFMAIDFYNNPRITGNGLDIGAAENTFGEIPGKPFIDYNNPPNKLDEPNEKSKMPDENLIVEQPVPSSSETITIDGIDGDWAAYRERSTSSSNARSMKAFMTNDKLYVLITGNLLTEKGQLFINVGTKGTSFSTPYWSDSGSEYMIENGTLYKYSGESGTDWKWTKVISYRQTGQYAASATAIEYEIPIIDLEEPKGSVSIGYVWKDSAENKLPLHNKKEVINTFLPEPMPTPDSNSIKTTK